MFGNKYWGLIIRKLEFKGRKFSYFGYKIYIQKIYKFFEDRFLFIYLNKYIKYLCMLDIILDNEELVVNKIKFIEFVQFIFQLWG